MFKSKLNELCQKSGWESPEYSCLKEGQDHSPLFRASVVVNGCSFQSSAVFKNTKAAYNDVAEIAFSHYSTFSQVPIDEMKKLKKLKLSSMSSCSNMGKGALNNNSEVSPPVLPEDIDRKTKTTEHVAPTNNKPTLNKPADSYMLCSKVRVYTSIPDVELPKGNVVLPIGEGKWTIASLE